MVDWASGNGGFHACVVEPVCLNTMTTGSPAALESTAPVPGRRTLRTRSMPWSSTFCSWRPSRWLTACSWQRLPTRMRQWAACWRCGARQTLPGRGTSGQHARELQGTVEDLRRQVIQLEGDRCGGLCTVDHDLLRGPLCWGLSLVTQLGYLPAKDNPSSFLAQPDCGTSSCQFWCNYTWQLSKAHL